MPKILLVSGNPENLEELKKALAADPSVTILTAGNAREALDKAGSEKPALAVLDSEIPGSATEKLLTDFLMVNAMMNTAVVSSMEEEEFHEKTEGLGIMMSLPEKPGAEDAARLLATLRSITGG